MSIGLVVLLAWATNIHRADPRKVPVTLDQKVTTAKVKAAAKSLLKNKPTVAAHIAVKAKAAKAPKAESPEEKIENALKANLDRTAQSLGKAELKPMLVNQGQSVLHNQQEDAAHKAVTKDATAILKNPTKVKSFDPEPESQQTRTEDALREQLNKATQAKENKLFKTTLQGEQGKMKSNNGMGSAQTAVSNKPTEQSEEDQLKAQLDARTKAKEKASFHNALKAWQEKQQHIEAKEKSTKHMMGKTADVFKATLQAAKQTSAKLTGDMHGHVRDAAVDGDKAPSFSQWLKAFKRQLSQRTKAANKKIVEGKYDTKNHKSYGQTMHKATQSRSKAKAAVTLLNKSLKLEHAEEKELSSATSKQKTPGQALAKLKATMAQERNALNALAHTEKGAGADPNLLSLAPKPAKLKSNDDDSSLLGLDDLNAI